MPHRGKLEKERHQERRDVQSHSPSDRPGACHARKGTTKCGVSWASVYPGNGFPGNLLRILFERAAGRQQSLVGFESRCRLVSRRYFLQGLVSATKPIARSAVRDLDVLTAQPQRDQNDEACQENAERKSPQGPVQSTSGTRTPHFGKNAELSISPIREVSPN